ncbi:DUF389 domain-containing protein [Synechococcus sp. CS-602]|uniref:DUF389 domain-containing protein n=1 Tax=Synechococcaceae TaxID=1890426 RepID=UPI0009F86434|nr:MULTISPECIES: DUF389 domain-containing protein [Synechococcaceae]MCT4364965.1 DUF389 domain-containing protein [Candidatus Regnicoccus frigidus MAG-AL1]MCT0202935.1 DUF389 domain-containing protein [Synechococcus sp. CS-603]MCT0205788.1 DUF389 domain-containing protein [Synechococcus sp. CS-602]MCT0245194.1 DUF389 domain-containing protein [Synechococcus sp. CS-601]MCT4367192.1 DUF389 domain-containing protein [Candidatus Regnicoccus frigidus MAG-AL2]
MVNPADYGDKGIDPAAYPKTRRVRELIAEFEDDARTTEVFIVLSLGSSLIASLGLLANSAAVVIGAMIIAPWITPLRATAFGILRGRVKLVLQGLFTLLLGGLIAVGVSVLLGWLSGLGDFGSEVQARTAPNLLDLGIALVAGGIAAYARLRSEAVSSLAGTAIAVALVPPVCALGLLLSASQWSVALGSGLLYLTNLMGILSGCLLVLAKSGPGLRNQMSRSRLGIVSLGLTALLVVPLTGSFLDLVRRSREELVQRQVATTIQTLLTRETVTLGQEAQIADFSINWDVNPPIIRVVVRASRPGEPTPKQVAEVQRLINQRERIRFQLVVERSPVEVVGPETAPNPIPEPARVPLLEPDLPPPPVLAPEPPEPEPKPLLQRTPLPPPPARPPGPGEAGIGSPD